MDLTQGKGKGEDKVLGKGHIHQVNVPNPRIRERQMMFIGGSVKEIFLLMF